MTARSHTRLRNAAKARASRRGVKRAARSTRQAEQRGRRRQANPGAAE